jgi:hypothetical protein
MDTSTQPNAHHGYDPANYYVWAAPGGFAVHLSLHIVRELAAQAAASGEIRGILLGRTVEAPFAATMAEDFVVIPASQNFEMARQAAEHDGRKLLVVGYFRSQRDGRLRLNARDVQTFERLFHEDGNIGLLIRSPRRGDCESALYYWQGGQPQPREFGFGFPLDAVKLAGGHPGWRFPDPLEAIEEAPEESANHWVPEAPVVASRSEGIRWSRLLPTAVLVVAAIVATQVLWNSRGKASANVTPAAEPVTVPEIPVTQASYESALALKVAPLPHQLEIRWNRAAPAIASATKGSMSISEGGVTESIPFDQQELREGYVAYTPKTNDVSVRLEVMGKDGAVTRESIRVVAIP